MTKMLFATKCLPNLSLSFGEENGNSGTVSVSEETILTCVSCLHALSTSSMHSCMRWSPQLSTMHLTSFSAFSIDSFSFIRRLCDPRERYLSSVTSPGLTFFSLTFLSASIDFLRDLTLRSLSTSIDCRTSGGCASNFEGFPPSTSLRRPFLVSCCETWYTFVRGTPDAYCIWLTVHAPLESRA